MAEPAEIQSIKPQPVRKGDRLTAAAMNTIIDAVRRTQGGVKPPVQVKSNPPGGGITELHVGDDTAASNKATEVKDDDNNTVALDDLIRIVEVSAGVFKLALNLQAIYVFDSGTNLTGALSTLLSVKADSTNFVCLKTAARYTDGTNTKQFGFKYDVTDTRWRPDEGYIADE